MPVFTTSSAYSDDDLTESVRATVSSMKRKQIAMASGALKNRKWHSFVHFRSALRKEAIAIAEAMIRQHGHGDICVETYPDLEADSTVIRVRLSR